MKNSISKLIIIVLILFFVSKIEAQKIQYFYFAPETSMQQAFGDKAKVFNRNDHNGVKYQELPGYEYVLIKSSNFTDFESIASPNMLKTYNRLTSNTSLKKEIDNLLKLSEGIVDVNVMLVDDRTGFSTTSLFCPKSDTADNQLFVWPCARIKKKKTGLGYLGQVFLGERAALIDVAKTGGFINWEGTVIHEFSHTQFLPDPKFGKNKWKSVGISYGGDAGHWFSELMADEQMALDEGMGYFFGLAHNPQAAKNLIDFLNTKDPRFLLGSRSFLTGTSKMWNSPHRIKYSGPVSNLPGWINLVNTPLEGNYELREYKWLDVPGKYIMYNEQMSEAYFYLYHRYAFADKKKAYKRVYLAAKEMAQPNVHNRYPTFAVNHMAKNMELYASSVPGEHDANNNTLVSSMFSYGLMDLLTHFDMTEEDFKKKLRKDQSGGTLPLAYTQYWSQRDKLKKLVCPFLGGSDCQNGTGNIDILKATEVTRDFFIDSNLILK
jgi:hypothetical protein